MPWVVLVVIACLAGSQSASPAPQAAAQVPAAPAVDPVKILVDRLDLDKYKATIKGLTQFGDRRQGTDRNRAAIDWIEAQLRSYGCTNTERIRYEYKTPAPRDTQAGAGAQAGVGRGGRGRTGQGGSVIFGRRARTGVNVDPTLQPDATLRALNSQPASDGPREEVYCTKIGTTHPEEMYIVGGHMDGYGWGEAANDDGSGTALVMEMARVLSAPDVETERSIRFALWNNEETGLDGAEAYVAQRKDLQGEENPPGSGRYPEPRWLGMIQHDMMLFDHGMPGPDGKVRAEQRPEADVNIEFQAASRFAEASQQLAWLFNSANEKYATDYPASVGPHKTNTDSTPFMDLVPSLSLRENERGAQIGAGWDPHWHQPSDVYTAFTDDDFRLGLNASQTTLGAIAKLAGATLKNRTAARPDASSPSVD